MSSTVVVIPRLPVGKAQAGGPGYALHPAWWRDDGGRVTVRCMCGHLMMIRDIQIDPDGRLWDVIECPTSKCGWSVWSKLEDWDG